MIDMQLLQQHTYPLTHSRREEKISVVQRFFTWCKNQDNNRLTWLAVILTGHGCIITPLTVMFIMITGNNPILWPIAIAAMGMCLVVNLAALPTKITIPVFFLSLTIDLAIIITGLSAGFSIPGTR
jgi:hypothetical protein